jgi:hypothetical protein
MLAGNKATYRNFRRINIGCAPGIVNKFSEPAQNLSRAPPYGAWRSAESPVYVLVHEHFEHRTRAIWQAQQDLDRFSGPTHEALTWAKQRKDFPMGDTVSAGASLWVEHGTPR